MNGSSSPLRSPLPLLDEPSEDVERQSLLSTQTKWRLFTVTMVSLMLFLILFYEFGPSDSSSSESSSNSGSGCKMPSYADDYLKLAHEDTFAALLKDRKEQYKFEASDVVIVGTDYYAVCDSSWALSKIGETMTPFSATNVQIGTPDRESEDSAYEALVYDDMNEIFYAVRESVDTEDGDGDEYHAVIEELRVSDDTQDYTVEATCVTEFEFDGTSKGFEGAVGMRDSTGELYLLGLCEGNECKKQGKKGHGQAVLMRKHSNSASSGYPCTWKTERVLDIPSDADFHDYSAISVNNAGRVAITSQEDSKVWLGWLSHFTPSASGGTFNPEKTNIVTHPDSDDDAQADLTRGVLRFPRDDSCHVVYCNIEGIHWMDDNTLLAVSDKAKDDQPFLCVARDQSIHAFSIPRS
jgi:hypothetical protein